MNGDLKFLIDMQLFYFSVEKNCYATRRV